MLRFRPFPMPVPLPVCRKSSSGMAAKFADRLLPFYDFDFYGGTSLSTFRYSGMSVQERYISIQEERREREFRRDRKRQEGEIQNQVNAMMENIAREAAEKAANITPEEKERLLKLYGLA